MRGLPERSALDSITSDDRSSALTPVEAVVEPKLDHLDALIDPEIPGETRRCGTRKLAIAVGLAVYSCRRAAVQPDGLGPEAQVVVFDEGRPVVEQAKFDTDARQPAPSVLVAAPRAGTVDGKECVLPDDVGISAEL